MTNVPYEIFNDFWNDLISDMPHHEVSELVSYILVHSDGFFRVSFCFALVIFLCVLIWDLFNGLINNGFLALSRIRLRKKFKNKYITDKPYDVHEEYYPGDGISFVVDSDFNKSVSFHNNMVMCLNEDNARLICLILNDDVIGKRFDIKAYTKGNNIKF